MNTKITVRTEQGDIWSCVLDEGAPIMPQLEQLTGIRAGGGLAPRLTETELQIVDYFHDEPQGVFVILRREPTEAPVCLTWDKGEK